MRSRSVALFGLAAGLLFILVSPLALWADDTSTSKVFISIGSAPHKTQLRNVLRSTWLRDCIDDPFCDYRFFTDKPERAQLAACNGDFCQEDMVLTPESLRGYTNFGTRGHMQLNYSLVHFDFDFYLRVDDDGMLCYQHFRDALRTLPKKRLIWGRYMCQRHLARMDENFLLLSRDLGKFFNDAWAQAPEVERRVGPVAPFTTLPWNGQKTMALNIGMVLPLLDVNIVGDSAAHFRWNEPIFESETFEAAPPSEPGDNGQAQLPKRVKCVDNAKLKNGLYADVGNVSAGKLGRCPDLCSRYIWLHHVSATTINRTYHELDTDINARSPKRLMMPFYRRDPSGCGWGQDIPLYKLGQFGGCTYYCPRVYGFNTSDPEHVRRVREYAAQHLP